ncbi:unnamed protein product [Spodoptera littoralis]|uniref:Uncharacterized protein n=1 Tax=Spodoptera littoralis TaxID=7109 RepID=A0A9P0N0M9_SPOLI|nr:unnamed protein product [Spodoptera littoralis]CAH1635555.1 unnamed protein product [Spodoptera littoralis]
MSSFGPSLAITSTFNFNFINIIINSH